MRFFLALAAAACIASPVLAASSKLDPMIRRGLQRVRAGVTLESLGESGIAVNRARELDVFIVGSASRAALEAAGARVRTELPGVVTAYVPADALERVAAIADVNSIQGAVRVEPQLNASVPTTSADQLRGPGPDFTGLNGAGVIVGVVDSGVDYDHPDFKNPDGTTRLLDIWDQTDNLGPHPAGFTYGTEWSPVAIDAGIAQEIDDDGHGTHVLGIAGGDGSATGGSVPPFTYVGMAPKADLIMVKTSFNTGIVDGVAYVMNRATTLGKNAVVNLSLGTLFGPKDGTSGFEAGLNALTGPGHIVVCAAGNSRGRLAHAEGTAPPGGSVTITQNLASGPGGLVAIDGYYEAGGNLSMTVTAPAGPTYGPVALGDSNAVYPGPLTSKGRIYFENGVTLTATGDREIYIELSVPNPNTSSANMGGLWTYTFTNQSPSAPVEVDLWTFRRNVTALFNQGEKNAKLVIEPANAPDVITVGGYFSKTGWIDCGGRSYVYGPPWQVGMLAGWSSPGPTRDGRQKPDLAAPGIGVGSALTHDVPIACPATDTSWYLNDGMQHFIDEGTSMAAPHVAGAVALLLQKYGAMTPAEIKTFLYSRAITDGFTGAVWNQDWGHGKLFLGDLTDPVAHVEEPNGGESLAVGSNATLTWTASDPYQGVTAVDLQLSRNNGGSFETIALGVPNTGSYGWTVSGPVTNQARLRITARDAAGNAGLDQSDATFSIADPLSAPGPGAITDYSLELRTPNPARGPIDVEFGVPAAAPVSVAVFDLAGRKVATLAQGIQTAGLHRARWGGAARSGSGIYFVRLSAPGRNLTQRVVVAE